MTKILRVRTAMWMSIGFIAPILVVIILNFGIHAWLPAICQVFGPLSSSLSTMSHDEHAIEISVGLATLLIVFFAFVQLGYSIRFIPPRFVTSYLLPHKYSLLYVSSSMSLIVLTAYFGSKISTSVLNQLIVIGSLPISVVAIVLYFRWIVNILTIERMVTTILGSFDFEEVKEYERALTQEMNSFVESLSEEEEGIVVRTSPSPHLFLTAGFRLTSNKIGFVKSIDIRRMNQVLIDKKRHIEDVELLVSIGSAFPPSYDNGLAIVKPSSDGTGNLKSHMQEVLELVKEKKKELEDCFEVDADSYQRLNSAIEDILEVYQHVAQESPNELDRVVGLLSSFLNDIRWGAPPQGDEESLEIKGYILQYFISGLNDLAEKGLSENQLSSMIPLFYAIRDHAIQRNDLALLSSILQTMNKLLFKMFIQGDRYNPTIATHVLYLKELTFSFTINDLMEKETLDEIRKKWKVFYEPLIEVGTRMAVGSMYHMVKFSYLKDNDETSIYLLHNGEIVVKFLENMLHWKSMSALADLKAVSVKDFGKKLLYFTFYMFRKSYHENFPGRLVHEVALPIATNAVGLGRYFGLSSEEFLNEIFFDGEFHYRVSSQMFEDPDITTAATGVGSFYDWSEFWATVSIYRHLSGAHFLPSNLSGPEMYAKNAITSMVKHLSSMRMERLEKILQTERGRITNEVCELKKHLEGLLATIKVN